MSIVDVVATGLVDSIVGRINAGSLIQRFFTTFDPIAQSYIGLSSAVNATQITMDVFSPSGTSVGLPTGAPAPTAGVLDTITFAFAGSISEIGRNGSDIFDGIIANVKIEDTGTLVLDMPIDQDYTPTNNTVLDLSPSGNNGTFVNVADGDSERYTFDTALNGWLGEELITQSVWENPLNVNPAWAYDVNDNTWSLVGDGSAQALDPLLISEIPNVYLISTPVLAFTAKTTGARFTDRQSNTGGSFIDKVGTLESITNKSVSGRVQYKRSIGRIDVTIGKSSVKSFLELAP